MHNVANIVIPPLDRSYSYLIPCTLSGIVQPGSFVEVPLGNRNTQGFVVSIGNDEIKHDFQLKELVRVLNSQSFTTEQIELFNWVANYYSCPIGNVLDTAIPTYVPPQICKVIKLIGKDCTAVKGTKQKQIIEFIQELSGSCDYKILQKRFKNCSTSLKSLLSAGHLTIEEIVSAPIQEKIINQSDWAKTSVDLNSEQLAAFKIVQSTIEKQEAQFYLLHGITGSGKTEVYIEAAHYALSLGRGALIVVPEIALTPQLISRFQARLGNNIAILHSAMNKRTRWNHWQNLLNGISTIAIGARSAIFAPVKNLGLIIVDEEHDSSYKQSDGLRYNARDLAVVRATLASCPVILGSATPSLESFHNALRGKYKYLTLKSRHSPASNLAIEVIDLNKIKSSQMKSQNISPQLHASMQSVLQTGGQIFVLYNRRGFASFLQCDCCGYSMPCPNCSVTLTYHQTRHTLQCHYCNLKQAPAEFCPQCQSSTDEAVRQKPGKLIQRGAGTEKIFDEIQELFPQYTIARLDRDVVDDQTSYEEVFDNLRSGKIKILVGTQMIAKGHDLPNVNLVGIVDCDVGLHFPDFRSSERVFQLLTQAAGRAGRGQTAGQVILQTRLPLHSSIKYTLSKNFSDFAKEELRKRKELLYPPYTKLLRVLASASENSVASELLVNLKNLVLPIIESEQLKVTVLGPAPAPLSRLKNNYRWHLLIKSSSTNDLQKVINLLRRAKISKSIKLIIDRDPQDML